MIEVVLDNFESDSPFPLDQLDGAWSAEKIFVNNTGDVHGSLAAPVILRENPKVQVTAEIIVDYLFVK